MQFKNHFKGKLHCSKVMTHDLMVPLKKFIEKYIYIYI